MSEAVKPATAREVTIIEPPTGWRSIDFAVLWRYRELAWVLATRDIRVRYKQTALGFAWAIIQPIMLMVVFSIFFGRLAGMPSDGAPYPVFVYAALLPWTFFANAVNASANSLVGSSNLVSKVYFPRVLIPVASIGGPLVDFAVAAVVLLALCGWYGLAPSTSLLMLPALVAATILVALGAGLFLSALNVAYRDFRYVTQFLLQFWMFASPVVYPASLVPQEIRWAYYLNPMAGIIEGFRSAVLGRAVDGEALAISCAVAIVVFAVGVAYFEKVERRFADII